MLYLLPNLLDETCDASLQLPKAVFDAVAEIDGLICENEKEGRRFLKRFRTKKILQEMPLQLLNEHTPSKDLEALVAPLIKGQTWGLVSDAGLPCIADPGAPLVQLARKKNIAIRAFAGPSSLMMALQLSGFSGQRFSFYGYLPKDS
ncbi:MAG TPA: SAM-dependent methyltransferase, partial [Chlamydiales bacterium]|nr:SAM-dependent methyltransferase [Chlamydiales bacterium]